MMGGMVGFGMASDYEGFASFHTVNGPHPEAFSESLIKSAEARYRSKFIRPIVERENSKSNPVPEVRSEVERLFYRTNCRWAAKDHMGYSCTFGTSLKRVGPSRINTAAIFGMDDIRMDVEDILARTNLYAGEKMLSSTPLYFEGGDIYATESCFVAKAIADFAYNPTSSSSVPSPPWAEVGRPGGQSNVLTREEVGASAAKCHDGSQAVLYRRPSASSSENYILYFEGSSSSVNNNSPPAPACWSPSSCDSFFSSFPHLEGSTTSPSSYPDTMPGFEVLSSDACDNPEFHDFTAIYVPYCTGDMHARGDVLKAIIIELNDSLGDSSTRNIVLAGAGPGAVGISTHLDWIKNTGLAATKVANLKIILDSAWNSSGGDLDATAFGAHWGLSDGHSCATPTSTTDSTPCCVNPTCATAKFQFPPSGASVLHIEANKLHVPAMTSAHELLYSFPHRVCPSGSDCSAPPDVKSIIALEGHNAIVGGSTIARMETSYR
jgi:hypothetical protein